MKDMKLNRFFNQMILVALAVLTVTFTACDNDDDNSGSMMLEAFGPSPALRGGKLTFIGRNLDRVTSVVLPDNIEITDIEVIDNQHIKVVIPQDAKEGYVKLRFAGGLEVTSKSLLTYTEPITVTKMSPSPVKAGEKLTLEGDYLNLIEKVVFADKVEVGSDDFVTWERKKIVVIVPRKAQTGKIILADNKTIPLELETKDELQIVLPSVEKTLDLTNKKPGEKVEVTVKDIDLVESVVLPNGDPIEFTIKDDVLSFILPTGVTDGVISMVAPSGVKVAIANIGMAVPSELEAAPTADLKAGDVITIKGLNMELTTTVTFPGVTTGVKPQSVTATSIKVEMPASAISGNLILNTASGNTSAPIAISTLKPVVMTYNPSPVAAGNEIVLEGKHLDLVASVTFGGDKKGVISSQTADQMVVKVPADAESGVVVLTMTNGETVNCASLEVTKPVFCYIPELPGDDVEIKAGEILMVKVNNGDKLQNVKVNGANAQYILNGSLLYIGIPSTAGGSTIVTLNSSNGTIDYTIDVIALGVVETIIYEGLCNFGNWAQNLELAASKFATVKAGTIVKFVYVTNETPNTWWQIKFQYMGDGWPSLDGYSDIVNVQQGSTEYELTLSATAAEQLIKYGMGVGGHELTISKVSLITKGGVAAQTIWSGSQAMGDWTGYLVLDDVSLFAKTKVGQKIIVKTKDVSEGAQGSFKNSSWSPIADGTDYFDITGDFELTVTDDILAELQSGGLIISGKKYTAVSVLIK